MTIQSIKSEICQLLNISSISANEAKQLSQASNIIGNWSKTETWQQLLNNLKASQVSLQEVITNDNTNNDESEVKDSRVITVSPVLTADSFIDLILANKIWLYHSYKITSIKFPSNNKAVLFSELLQDNFVVSKKSNYVLTFKSVTHELEETAELFSFDWLKISNYYFELKDNQLIKGIGVKSDNTEYRSVAIPLGVNKANQLILNIANFKQQNTADKLSNNIKTFKDWTRTIYLELPESKLNDFLAGLTRNHARQAIEQVKEAFKVNTRVTGKMLNHNSSVGAMNFYNEPHLDIKGRYQPKKAVLLTRNEDKYTPITDSYFSITVAELFKLLDITVDMSAYVRYVGFCGYWKLVIISHLLNRTTFKLNNEWQTLVSSHLKINNFNSGYVLVEEIDNRRFNNKIRMNNNVSFTMSQDTSGKVESSYLEFNTVKVIERVDIKHSNMIKSNAKSKSMKRTNKGGNTANYIKLAETNNYELRLFYLEDKSIAPPHNSFKEVLANITYTDKQTSITNVMGQVWIKETRNKNNVLYFSVTQEVRDKTTSIINNDVQKKILVYKNHVERLSAKIRELRKQKEDFNLLNERVIINDTGLGVGVVSESEITKELRGLIEEKLKYELEIKSYDLNLPFEVITALYNLGINLLTNGIVPRELNWEQIFSSLELEIPILKDNAILVKGNKH